MKLSTALLSLCLLGGVSAAPTLGDATKISVVNGFQVAEFIGEDGTEKIVFTDLLNSTWAAPDLSGLTRSLLGYPEDSGDAEDSDLEERAPVAKALTQETYNYLEKQVKLANIAYCGGTSQLISPFVCAYQCKEFPTVELVTTWDTDGLNVSPAVAGYLAIDHESKEFILGFRGSKTLKDWLVNLNTIRVPVNKKYAPCKGCEVHLGFYNAYKATLGIFESTLTYLRSKHPEYRLNVVGHSLGGAVALLVATDFKQRGYDTQLTTFGQPIVGNTKFANHIDNLWFGTQAESSTGQFHRVTHRNDIVPLVPFWLGYSQTAGEIFIGAPNLAPPLDSLRVCEGRNSRECLNGNSILGLLELSAHTEYFVALGGDC
uniref:triacylglycerol lipase n=1 Tax=Yarrowia alimentaria TaxID=479092 RepID=A0A078BMS8_9ASCO|nr:lipase [Yarrowia alimentaria]